MIAIRNARIWTGDKARPYADTMEFENGIIRYVGQGKNRASKVENVIDAGGRLVIPSFLDPHTHVTAVARSQWLFLLKRGGYKSITEIFQAIRQYTLQHPKEAVPFLYATSAPTEWVSKARKEDFDRYVSDRPALLCDQGFHQCLVNSCMLNLMDITADTPYDPTTTMNYERYPDGSPNGVVYEHRYERDIDKMYQKIGWHPPATNDLTCLKPYLDQMNRWGISGVLDGFTEDEGTLKAFRTLDDQGRLHMYYHANSLFYGLADVDEAIERARFWQKTYGTRHILSDSCKLFLDGTNEIGTAALLRPQACDPENYGQINLTEDELTEVIRRINAARLHLQIHLVGDRAFRVAVNAYERVKRELEENGEMIYTQMTLLHCELTDPVDRRRIAPLGIRINFTPHWNGGCFGSEALKYVGQERFDTFYSFRDFFRYGCHISASSDTVDKEDMPRTNPFVGIEVGHTRHDDHTEFSIREPRSECLPREDLLSAYTLGAADCMHETHRAGSLTPGKAANFCILDRDVLEVPAEEIHTVSPIQVFFEGERIV
ncbi:MAG: amidohydrolase [Bilifractor sp.]